MRRDLPISDAFGNALVKGIAEIRQPEPVSWTPATSGWMAVGAILTGIVFWLLFRFFRLWRRNAYRRLALSRLRYLEKRKVFDETAFLQALPPLLKETAIAAYPGSEAASLTGGRWLGFLENQVPGIGFADAVGRRLIEIAYQDPRKWTITARETKTLTTMVKHWICRHRTEACHA